MLFGANELTLVQTLAAKFVPMSSNPGTHRLEELTPTSYPLTYTCL